MRETKMTSLSKETGVLGFFVGEQRFGVGQFRAEPETDTWFWDDAVYAAFGYPARSCRPCWKLMLARIPAGERESIDTAYATAARQSGPFSWSHGVLGADGVLRSVLVVGNAVRGHEQLITGSTAQVAEQAIETSRAGPLVLSGYILDLTDQRLQAARSAGTDTVHRSNVHRGVIEQAKGVLMLAYHLDADAAFALLAWHSQRNNQKLHAVAAQVMAVVRADGLPSAHLRITLDRALAGASATSPAAVE